MTKTLILVLIVTFPLCNYIIAQRGNGPQISLISNIDLDFDIERNSAMTCVFRFKNSGNVPLHITDVYSSLNSPFSRANVTSIKWPPKPVKPGKTGSFVVTFAAKDQPGSFDEDIFVSSNADDTDLAVLHINGNVFLLPGTTLGKYERQLARQQGRTGIGYSVLQLMGIIISVFNK